MRSDDVSLNHNGGRSSVIADGNVQPVFSKSVLRPANDRSDVESVISARIEISIISDLGRQLHLNILDLMKKLPEFFLVGFKRRTFAEQLLNGLSDFFPMTTI